MTLSASTVYQNVGARQVRGVTRCSVRLFALTGRERSLLEHRGVDAIARPREACLIDRHNCLLGLSAGSASIVAAKDAKTILGLAGGARELWNAFGFSQTDTRRPGDDYGKAS